MWRSWRRRGWGAGALWFQSPHGGAWRALSVACWLALAGAALLGLALEHAAPLWLFGAALLGLLAWWRLGVRPSNARSWMPEVARTTCGDIDGDRVTLHDVRDFDWRTRSADVRWRTRPTICRVWNRWMSRCRTGAPAIAHALVSFGFGDGRHVVFSVEVRRKLGDAFSEIGGFFRQYELSVLASTERTACGYAPMCAARTVTCIACMPEAGRARCSWPMSRRPTGWRVNRASTTR